MTERPPRKLGRGLESLISARIPVEPPKSTPPAGKPAGRAVEKIPLDLLDPNPWQPRREFSQTAIEDLVRSIQEHGLLQPIVVRRHAGRFTIIAGERRWRACQELGTGSIDGMVLEATDRQMLEFAIIENLQREDLGPIETARALQRLVSEFDMTHDEVAHAVGKSRPQVANLIRLLDLPTNILDLVSRGTVSAGAARALLAVKDRAEQTALAQQVADGRLTVRDVEKAAQRKPGMLRLGARTPDANLAEVAEDLQRAVGLRVKIHGTPKRGSVAFSYRSAQELAAFCNRLHAPQAGSPRSSGASATGEALTAS